MFRRLGKCVNGLGIRITSHLVKGFSLGQGSTLDIVREDDHLAIYPPKYDLKSMVDTISNDNKYESIWEGINTVGKKVWR
jgi:antitoxin component of MazEF toxin-antitoxin module